MLKKCDFCSYYNSSTRRCGSSTGSSACHHAAEAFAKYANTLARNRNTRTKNVNVNKHSSHNHYNKKR